MAMLNVRRLTPEEVKVFTAAEQRSVNRAAGGKRAALAAEYKESLAAMQIGDVVEIVLDKDSQALTHRKHFTAAAGALGCGVTFRRDGLKFYVKKVDTMPAPKARKSGGGRKPKAPAADVAPAPAPDAAPVKAPKARKPKAAKPSAAVA